MIVKINQKHRRNLGMITDIYLHAIRKERMFHKEENLFIIRKRVQFLWTGQSPIIDTKLCDITAQTIPDIRVGDQSHHQAGLHFLNANARRFVHDLLREGEGKFASLFIFALHPDFSIHQIEQSLRDGKPQSCPLDIAVSLAVKLLKGLE